MPIDLVLTLILIVAVSCLLILVVLWLKKSQKITACENQDDVERTVTKILEQISWESKQRWVNKDTLEFVTIIIGKIPGHHKIWARFWMTKKDRRVLIEYDSDTQVVHRDLVRSYVECFNRKGIPAISCTASRQPTLEEISVPALALASWFGTLLDDYSRPDDDPR